MRYVPTDLGLMSASLISLILLFIAVCKAPSIRLKHGKLREMMYLSLVSLLYFFLWFVAIVMAGSIFSINLAPVMSKLAIFSIISPYVLVIVLHVFGFTMSFRW